MVMMVIWWWWWYDGGDDDDDSSDDDDDDGDDVDDNDYDDDLRVFQTQEPEARQERAGGAGAEARQRGWGLFPETLLQE